MKVDRGTFRPDRDGGVVEVIEPTAMPMQPDWLTPEGEEVWMDDVGRVEAHRLVSEKDSTSFGNYCNLQGGVVRAWRAGEIPPVSALTEVRKMAEQFGIFGAKSRLKIAAGGEASKNPFGRNGRRG
jgi:hypothetical protein